MRYTTGAPGVVDGPNYWQWNPDHNLPYGRMWPADGQEYRLATVNVPADTELVNLQYAFAADPGEYFVTMGFRDNGKLFDSATVVHPSLGFGIHDGNQGTIYKRLVPPYKLKAGHQLDFVASATAKGNGGNVGQCNGLACAAGIVLYGIAVNAEAPEGIKGADFQAVPPNLQVNNFTYHGIPTGAHSNITLYVSTNGAGHGAQPMSYVTTSDGQMPAFFTTEDYHQQGGSIAYTVDFAPDYLLVPEGSWTFTVDQRWQSGEWNPADGDEKPGLFGVLLNILPYPTNRCTQNLNAWCEFTNIGGTEGASRQ
jgi:hypothetical protein